MGARQTAVLLSPAYDRNEYLGAESLGIRAIAAVLDRDGTDVHVFDEVAELSEPHRKAIAGASLVGIGTLFTRQIPDAMELAQQVRTLAPTAHITIGGQGVSFLWRRVLEDCSAIDSCCMYEGDETIRVLWERLRRGQTPTEVDGLHVRVDGLIHAPPRPRGPVPDLDDLPFVYRASSNGLYSDGHATMYTSRGCAAHCSFCQSGNYGNRYHKLPKWRYRSAANMVQEIKDLLTAGIDAISIVDDDFLGGDGQGRRRAEEFSRLLTEEGIDVKFSIECRVDEIDREILSMLHAVGLRHVLIGIESANQLDDNLFAKKVTTAQI